MSQLTEHQVQAAAEQYQLKQEAAARHRTARAEPGHDPVPANRHPAPGPENDLWANIVPNQPPDHWSSRTEQARGQRK
jgi:hypothetical protein